MVASNPFAPEALPVICVPYPLELVPFSCQFALMLAVEFAVGANSLYALLPAALTYRSTVTLPVMVPVELPILPVPAAVDLIVMLPPLFTAKSVPVPLFTVNTTFGLSISVPPEYTVVWSVVRLAEMVTI